MDEELTLMPVIQRMGEWSGDALDNGIRHVEMPFQSLLKSAH
jgi:hypothetical protein